MEIDVPVNMNEVEMAVSKRQENGEDVTVESIIKETVLDSFQAYLDTAEEGHYDSAKWDGDNLKVIDIMGADGAVIKPMTTDFVADFKLNADALFFYLQDEAGKAAEGR
ncbi:hypothetical protein [Secundilactobacillus kimchicus]|uniref:hypothetical protein n=1 Tax=Secundilactobacillus kimchicus TaxID=528209 RepID=UPI0024A7B471|nr:hypothetical protein [Secundilactobacillus kimchicus]